MRIRVLRVYIHVGVYPIYEVVNGGGGGGGGSGGEFEREKEKEERGEGERERTTFALHSYHSQSLTLNNRACNWGKF